MHQNFCLTENFQQFLIRKIIHIELALNNVKENQKLLLQKLLMGSVDTQEKENIDVLNDFPLKTQSDLDTVEIKLKNDYVYRDQMVSRMFVFYYKISLKKETITIPKLPVHLSSYLPSDTSAGDFHPSTYPFASFAKWMREEFPSAFV